MANGFEDALHDIRSNAGTEAAKGRLFERLIKQCFSEDPLYRDRFTRVGARYEFLSAAPRRQRSE